VCVYEGEREGSPLVHASGVGKLDGRSAEVTDSEVLVSHKIVSPQAHEVIQRFPVLVLGVGDDIHGWGAACACGVGVCGVEVGRGVAPVAAAAAAAAVAVAAVEAAIVAAVREGIGAELGGLAAAAVAVGHRWASLRQDT
jgi:hypothetical protein